jgi:type II secretory pathway pseudopilin PulG
MITLDRQSVIGDSKTSERESEQGFMLLGLIVAIFIMLLTLSAAAPIMARSLRRDRELEAVHRGNQYTRAIQLYYRKFGHYPGSLEQLENSNNIRFLRQRYKDPINGKEDWRMIPVGQNQTTVKGFFGEPLAGLPTTGAGAGSVSLSAGIGGASMSGITMGANAPGGAGASGSLTLGSSGAIGASGAAGAAGSLSLGSTPGTPGAGTGAAGATDPSGAAGGGTTGGIGGQATPGLGLGAGSGTGQPFMGMGLNASGESIVVLNEQKSYGTWEFLYDPRVDQMKAKAAALNGGGVSGGGLGSTTLGTSPGIGTGSATGSTAPGGVAPSGAPAAAAPPSQTPQ